MNTCLSAIFSPHCVMVMPDYSAPSRQILAEQESGIGVIESGQEAAVPRQTTISKSHNKSRHPARKKGGGSQKMATGHHGGSASVGNSSRVKKSSQSTRGTHASGQSSLKQTAVCMPNMWTLSLHRQSWWLLRGAHPFSQNNQGLNRFFFRW